MSGWGDDTRNDALTSNKIAGMSDDARTELARQLNSEVDDTASSYRRSTAPIRREPAPRDRTGRREPSDDETVAQLAADLHRTERRLKKSGGTVSQARQTRLANRAKRLKRQLRRAS
jgi:hypothetical protein